MSTPVVTPERAQAIWDARGPMGEWPKGSYTPEEDAYICEVWKTLPGDTSWADALLSIARLRPGKSRGARMPKTKHRFTLSIDLGNAAMRTGQDVVDAMRRLFVLIEDREAGNIASGVVRDVNGNRVGTWSLNLPSREDDDA